MCCCLMLDYDDLVFMFDVCFFVCFLCVVVDIVFVWFIWGFFRSTVGIMLLVLELMFVAGFMCTSPCDVKLLNL